MIDPVALLQDLIRCASVTPLDKGAQDVLINALTPLGFKSYDVTRGNIRNTFLRYDGQAGDNTPHFCFAGHTDVVPVGDETLWTHPPFAAVIDDADIVGVFRLEIVGQQQLRHAQHTIERRADLVAHRGQEFGLGA